MQSVVPDEPAVEVAGFEGDPVVGAGVFREQFAEALAFALLAAEDDDDVRPGVGEVVQFRDGLGGVGVEGVQGADGQGDRVVLWAVDAAVLVDLDVHAAGQGFEQGGGGPDPDGVGQAFVVPACLLGEFHRFVQDNGGLWAEDREEVDALVVVQDGLGVGADDADRPECVG